MTAAAEPLVDIHGLIKNYGGLRPIRVEAFAVRPGEHVALLGLDRDAAEMFVTLVTGAALPDEGRISLFGQPTSEIPDGDRWIALLDRLGILSERAVLVQQYTAAQNIAMPFTLDLEPVPAEVLARVAALAGEVGLSADALDTPVGRVTPDVEVRVRLARALALDPALLLAEHPSAPLPRDRVAAFARDLAAVARRRNLGLVAISADKDFVRAFDGTPLQIEAATGRVRKQTWWEKRGLT